MFASFNQLPNIGRKSVIGYRCKFELEANDLCNFCNFFMMGVMNFDEHLNSRSFSDTLFYEID